MSQSGTGSAEHDPRHGAYAGCGRGSGPARSREEEIRNLREENLRLKKALELERAKVSKTALAWDEEHRVRMNAEEAWHRSLNDFTHWFNTAAFGMICVASDGSIVQVNRAATEMLGYSRDEYIGCQLATLLEEPEVVAKILAATEGGSIPGAQMARVQCRDGKVRTVLIGCQPFEQGGQQQGICCSLQDVSGMEESKGRQEDREELFRQLTENIREVFWMTNADKSEMLYVSPAYEEVWGATRQSLYEHPASFLDAIHPHDREQVIASLPLQREVGGYNQEYRILLPDGSTRWIRDRAFPILDQKGQVYRIAGIAEDVTALKGAREGLSHFARQQQALADLGRTAIETTVLQDLFQTSVERVAQTLGAEFAKVLELQPEDNEFVLRAAVGWPDEMIGRAKVPAGGDSQAGFTLLRQHPVVVDNLPTERRFRGQSLLVDWGVRSGVSVLIGCRGRAYGVLSVHSRTPKRFTMEDIHFVEAVAHLLAAAVERVASSERQEGLSLALIRERQRVNDILKSVPGVVWEMERTEDPEVLKLTFVSEYVETMLGYSRHLWLADPGFWVERIHPEDRERVVGEVRKALELGRVEEVAFRFVARNGRSIWVESHKMLFFDREGKTAGLRGVLLDVSARVEAEADRGAAEKRFRTFMDNSPVIAFIKDPEGRYIYGNKAFQETIKLKRQDWLGRTDEELFPGNLALPFREKDGEALQEAAPLQVIETIQDPDGGIRYWALFRFPLENQNGARCLGAVGLDITERRRLQTEILEISDREQRRMGQDLHDGLCQHLLGLAMMSKTLAEKMGKNGYQEAKIAREISSLLYEAVAVARGLMRGLHLVTVEAGGLVAALSEFCETTHRLFGKICELEVQRGVDVTDNTVATHIFRIAQEATNNAIKHGNAKRVTIRLSEENGGLVVAVEDDGRGLPEVMDPQGMGLHTMQYRASLIGAALTLSNRPEGGAVTRCVLPRHPQVRFE
jgi:PAS domain S-box-containing protein